MRRVIIIGAGPSALFAAKTILENSQHITVEIIEQGKLQTERFCSADFSQCKGCSNCDTLQGVGGAGLFSDGKLVLDLTSGGKAEGISLLAINERQKLEDYIKDTFISFDGVSEAKNIPSNEIQNYLNSIYQEKNLKIKLYNVLHMGTKNLKNITNNFIEYLNKNFEKRFRIITETIVTNIVKNVSGYFAVTNKGNIYADIIVAAVGKSGALWLSEILKSLGCNFTSHDFFFGFRMETSIENIRNMIKYSFDPKIYRIDSDRKVKIHCVCRQGKIRYARYRNGLIIGGHSPLTKNNSNQNIKSKHSSFNVLVSFNKDLFSPEDLLKEFQTSDNTVLVQKLSDFIENRVSTSFGIVIPDNLAMVKLGNFRSFMDSIDPEFSPIIIRFLSSLAELYPGVMDGDNLLYSPAIEWDMDTVTVNQYMETEQKNLFALGDGAGLSQGIVYSAATGIIAAKEIVRRLEGSVVCEF